MWNEVLNLTAGTIGMATSVGLLTWLTYYAMHTPLNKELKEYEKNKEKEKNND